MKVLSYLFIIFLFIYFCASGFDFTMKENGLQIDQPPEIGNASVIRIIISKSDNAEGIIEFDPSHARLEGMVVPTALFQSFILF